MARQTGWHADAGLPAGLPHVEGRPGRLSQTGLLDLMGQVDEKYSELHGHSTVARWESGATNPSRDRIRVFGQALNLSPVGE